VIVGDPRRWAWKVLCHINREDGQALVEYALLLSLIAIVAVASVETFGIRVFQMYSHIVSVYP
jgi:Flp pilus assembly pilin Flp